MWHCMNLIGQVLMNAQDHGEVILGASTSQLMQNLSETYRRAGAISAQDEIVVDEAGHEANIGPWARLAQETGAALVFWKAQTSPPFTSRLDDLKAVVNKRYFCSLDNCSCRVPACSHT